MQPPAIGTKLRFDRYSPDGISSFPCRTFFFSALFPFFSSMRRPSHWRKYPLTMSTSKDVADTFPLKIAATGFIPPDATLPLPFPLLFFFSGVPPTFSHCSIPPSVLPGVHCNISLFPVVVVDGPMSFQPFPPPLSIEPVATSGKSLTLSMTVIRIFFFGSTARSFIPSLKQCVRSLSPPPPSDIFDFLTSRLIFSYPI